MRGLSSFSGCVLETAEVGKECCVCARVCMCVVCSCGGQRLSSFSGYMLETLLRLVRRAMCAYMRVCMRVSAAVEARDCLLLVDTC